MSIGDRLKLIRKEISETQKGMAKRIGASHRTYQEWEAQNNVPNGKYLHVISQMGYNINWLLSGEGNMKIERVIGINHDVSTVTADMNEVVPFIATTDKNLQLYTIETTSLEPEINKGDALFYDIRASSCERITDGGIYILQVPGAKIVKRLLYKDSNTIEATCNFSSFNLDDDCKILGRVVYCLQAK